MNRRHFLFAATAAPAFARAAAPVRPVWDCHTHFYDPTRPEGVPWPEKGTKLYRKVLPVDYKALATPLGITGTVVVEASPWLEDNAWLLKLAKDDPFLVGVIGRLDLADSGFSKNLTRFAADPKFRGIRLNHDDVKAAALNPVQRDKLKQLADAKLTLDVNVGPAGLPFAATLAAFLPKLRVVVNHLGGPAADGKAPADDWLKGLKACATRDNTWLKFSGIVEASRKPDAAPPDAAFYKPVLDAAFDTFGAKRLVFGSNWPVSELFAPLTAVHKLAADYLGAKADGAKAWGANAAAAYGL